MKKSKAYKKFIRALAIIYLFFRSLFRVLKANRKYRLQVVGIICGIVILTVALVLGCKGIAARSGASSEGEEGPTIAQTEPAKDFVERIVAENQVEEEQRDQLWYGSYDVNLVEFTERYTECVGWIYFEDGSISYPIMKGSDNEAYLNKDYTGAPSTAGAIMLEQINLNDFSDKHILLYGHNMANQTMFGKLKNYTSRDYYEKHQYFQITWVDASGTVVKYRYRIFACRNVSVDDDAYTVWNDNYQNMASFAENSLRTGSYIDTHDTIAVTDEDQVVTLSTCSKKSDRFIVSGVLCGKCAVFE